MQLSIEEISNQILKNEKINDWSIRWWMSPPSQCDHHIKEIWISESYKSQPIYYQFEILLHEISHIENKNHDHLFFERLGNLFLKYSFFFNNICTEETIK